MAFIEAIKAQLGRLIEPSPTENDAVVKDLADFSEDESSDKYRCQIEATVNSNDWLKRVMVMPWKELFLDYLSKEGWTWIYGKGIEG